MDRFLDSLPFVVAAVLVAAIIGVLGYAIIYTVQVGGRKHDSEHTITRLCDERGGGVFFDVQGENKMVYACNDDGRLRVRAY